VYPANTLDNNSLLTIGVDKMIIKCEDYHIRDALEQSNKEFDDNLIFKRFEFIGQTRDKTDKYRVTLTVKSSKEKGGRIGHSGKRVAAACWHAHGTFFDNLPVGTEIIVGNSNKIYAGDRWVDTNIGSVYNPLYYSEACECYL
jgi:hypothetical protein